MLGNKITNEMILRIMTGIMLAPLILGAIIFSKTLLDGIIFAVSVGMFFEWYNMTHSDKKILIIGLLIIAIPMGSLHAISELNPNYIFIFITYAAIIGSTDIFSLVGGKIIGGTKLAPQISPKKTWSGLASGVVAASFFAHLISYLPGYDFPLSGFSLTIFGAITAIFAQMSDLLISYFKRMFELKDTGDILPGHGGVLDRFDSLILTAPILLYITL